MMLTDIRIQPADENAERLLAFVTITIDNAFCIRDLKLIEGRGRGLFVAMPSRKLMGRCPECEGKNHLKARYCNDCGELLPVFVPERDGMGRSAFHADVAFPIHPACRQTLEATIIKEYYAEVSRAKLANGDCKASTVTTGQSSDSS